ncbi:MAG: GntR family transcriptional regulator [Burkholderiales bacterium]
MKSNTPLFRKAATRAAVGGAEGASRSERAYQLLRRAIESGELKPGQRVMEVEAAEWLDMSRTPVREALRRLESEGMLTVEPRTGLVVASISRQAMLELYVMREVLEGTAARLCARHASDLELMELEELVKREARLDGNYEALARHNRLFHEAVHRGAHNRYLEKSLSAVNDSMYLLGKSMMLLPERAKLSKTEHAELMGAIARRDPDTAEQVARQHVRSAQQQRLKQLFPEG